MDENNNQNLQPDNRVIRVFISSTFRDMQDERDELMTHTWPELRRFCQERFVELVEVDLRWGISESQSKSNETIKLCLDEIRDCRPFFIGLLSERYGWTPSEEAFNADLREEQPWLVGARGKSATELEILHGVLNNPDIARRAFFYFRDPAYAQARGPDFLSETTEDADKQNTLKTKIRIACKAKQIPLRENYSDPRQLAGMVMADLRAAIEVQFPKEKIPDSLTRNAREHETFAEARRRTYIGRAAYYETLDNHAAGDGSPLLLLGDSGSGKSTLLANWLAHWRKDHPNDFIFQHYIGGTTDSADHWQLMTRLIAEIKRWSDDPEKLPYTHDNLLKDMPLWLAKAKTRAVHEGVRCILVLDALNQLEDREHARLLGWLPEIIFTGPLRLIVSTLPGQTGSDDPLQVIRERGWQELQVQPLTVEERQHLIDDYLTRFGKKLDEKRRDRLADAKPAANPLYLKILLDDLRVTGTHDLLDPRLTEYLEAKDIPALLQQVLARFQRSYERDRSGLVGETLGLIYAARRGLSETELLHLLRPADLPQLPPAHWSPLRAGLEGLLVDRGGILNFAHDFISKAVENTFAAEANCRNALHLQLAGYFEAQPITARTCDELPWLLKEIKSFDRLRACLLNIDRFLLIKQRDEQELLRYWVEELQQQQTMGKAYLENFELWSKEPGRSESDISTMAQRLAEFFMSAALYIEAEPLMRRALEIDECSLGRDHPIVSKHLRNLYVLLHHTNRMDEAEPLIRRALEFDERCFQIDESGFRKENPLVAEDLDLLSQLLMDTRRFNEAEPFIRRSLEIKERNLGENNLGVAVSLILLASLLKETNRMDQAEPLIRRALEIDEHNLGRDHPKVAIDLNDLALLLNASNRLAEAEPLFRRAIEIEEHNLGKDHPYVAVSLVNLADLFLATNRLDEAEPLFRRALEINERSLGKDHHITAHNLHALAVLLYHTKRLAEAEPLLRRAIDINEHSLGKDHPDVAIGIYSLAQLLKTSGRLAEAEPLFRRVLEIDERNFGREHPKVAIDLNDLAQLLKAFNRLAEAEPLFRRALEIDEHNFGKDHPNVAIRIKNLVFLLKDINRLTEAEALMRRALEIDEHTLGRDHPLVATSLNNLAQLLQASNRLEEAEPLMRHALEIDERFYGKDHPDVAIGLNNLAQLLQVSNRHSEAEPLMRRALGIYELNYGKDHPDVAIGLNNLGGLFQAMHQFTDAEPLMRRALEILIKLTRDTRRPHPYLLTFVNNYIRLLKVMGQSQEEIMATLRRMAPDLLFHV